MLPSNATAAQYHGDGPIFPGEDVHQALGENTAYSLGGHLLGASIQGVSGPSSFSPQPDPHPFEDQPTDDAENASQHLVQNVYRSANGELSNGTQGI